MNSIYVKIGMARLHNVTARNGVLSKLLFAWLIKKFITVNGTWRFISVLCSRELDTVLSQLNPFITHTLCF